MTAQERDEQFNAITAAIIAAWPWPDVTPRFELMESNLDHPVLKVTARVTGTIVLTNLTPPPIAAQLVVEGFTKHWTKS